MCESCALVGASRLLRVATVVYVLRHDARAAPSKWIPSYAGPFVLYMDRMYSCPPPDNKENMFDVHIRPSHFRSPSLVQTTLQTLDGNFTWKTTVDDSWVGVLKSDLWNNNQWKENSILYRIPRGFCSTIRTNFPGLYETFYGVSALTKTPCRFPKKTYILDNKPINWTMPNFPVLPYGRFKTTCLTFSAKNDKAACFVFEVNIVAKL
ncbi:Glycerol metabolism operon regulatory protein [Frankliniella fusca]|uniref:Glycerol metabolism operon regulatory protein n=1 Tax=Frankliniella fusca TaxID=407009 RepID=A0AAE1LF44_9NEOP|nr:Glycerol metabolism operon regulatory protein [Frankliniella fusca]